MALTDYELAPTARRVMNIFLLIDTSTSMTGEKIAAVNDAMRNILPIIDDISQNNPDAEIKIAPLTFGAGVSWMTNGPVSASSLTWNDCVAGGMTPMGEACRELNGKLSHKTGFMKSTSGSYAPVAIMLSDGAPTDDFAGAMNSLNANKWFTHATRIAIAIGSDADVDTLAKFTGNKELVLRVSNIDALKSLIQVVVVTSSMVNSSSSSVATAAASTGQAAPTKAQQTAAAIADGVGDISGISVGDADLIEALDFDDFD